MSKLIRANITRLSKSTVFYLCIAGIFVMTAFNILSGVSSIEAYAEDGITCTLETAQFDMLPILGVFSAVFCSLFFGTEYSDLTLRNKLMVGHSRLNIYLSNFLTACIGDIILLLTWFVAGAVGIKDFGLWAMGASELIKYLGVAILFTVSCTALLTLMFMLCDNKAVNAVVSILVILGMLVLASTFYNLLGEPEISPAQTYYDGGKMLMTEEMPNPAYIGGASRQIVTAIFYLLPGGQAIIAANLELTEPVTLCLYSVGLTVFAVIAGIILFRKKDLK